MFIQATTKRGEERWRAEFLLSSIVLKTRNAVPEDNTIIACWTADWQAFSIISAAAVTAITLEAIVAKIPILPRKGEHQNWSDFWPTAFHLFLTVWIDIQPKWLLFTFKLKPAKTVFLYTHNFKNVLYSKLVDHIILWGIKQKAQLHCNCVLLIEKN